MSPLLGAPGTTTASGFEDGFGRRRLLFARDDGAVFERLHLRPEFSIYEAALRDTCARMAANPDAGAGGRIVAPRAIERDAGTGELVAVSPFVCGERLTDLLDAAAERARDDEAFPGIDAALGFLLEVLPALGALRAATGMSHGAISPSRCVFTPEGHVVLTECGFAPVLQRLNLSRQRLWREFRVAMPPVAGPARFDETSDISQAAVAAVMLVVGRPMGDGDAGDVLPDWLSEVIEIAQIRGSVSFAVNLQRFLQRALPLPGRRPYLTFDAALQDVRQLAAGIGVDVCHTSIAQCVRQATGECGAAPAAAPVSVDEWHEMDLARDAAPAVAPVSSGEWQEIDLHDIDLPELPEPTPARITEEPIIIVPEEPGREPPVFEPVIEPMVEDRAVAAAPPIPSPTPPAVPEPPAAEIRPPDAIDPVVTRRRRARSKRHWVDALRSAITRAAPPEPEPQPEPAAARVAEPVPLAPAAVAVAPIAPAPIAAEPIAPEPIAPEPLAPAPIARPAAAAPPSFTLAPPVQQPYVPEPVALRPMLPQSLSAAPVVPLPVAPEPVLPQPVFVPLAAPAAERFWQPPQEAAPVPAVTIVPKPITVARATPAPIKVRSNSVTTPRPGRFPPRDFPVRDVVPRLPAHAGDGRPSWKFAAAAAAVMITVIAAGRAYLPDNSSLKAEAQDRPAPVTVTAPPPVTTGTIVAQTQPEGARVLLDGSPAGETPLRIVDVAAGRHVLTFVTPTATLKRTVKVEPNKTVTLDIPVFSGWVAIFAPIVLEVSEQGRALGSTDQGRLLLPPGRHTLTLANRDFGYSADHAVEIEPGEVCSLNIQPKGTLNLNAVPWAEVWIDGKKAGDTPIANFELPIGNREVIFRHPELGERKVMTRVTAGPPVAVSVDFSR